MRLTRLLRTSTFRLALVYAAVFALSGLAILAFIRWTTARVIDSDTRSAIQSEIDELVSRYRDGGPGALTAAIDERSLGPRGKRFFYLLADQKYRRVVGNLNQWPDAAQGDDGWVDFGVRGPGNAAAPTQPALARAVLLPGGFRLLVGRDLSELVKFRLLMEETLVGAGIITLLLGIAGGMVMSRRVLARIETINRSARKILAGNMKERVPLLGTGDEFDQLAGNLNAMLERIEELVAAMREVTDNIAHDLRSPLSRIRSRLEITLLGNPDEATAREALERTIADADQVLDTFNALLSIAQIESGSIQERMEPLDLETLVRDAADLYLPLAEEKEQDLIVRSAAGVTVTGNRRLLSQALSNLLDNAIKYTPAGGRIVVTADAAPEGARLAVADSGPGVPPEARDTVLRRFARLETSRHKTGTGLGLSLVAAVAHMHRAGLRLEDNAPGLRVVLTFPGSPPESAWRGDGGNDNGSGA